MADDDRQIYLCDVALTQFDMGVRAGGAETLQRVVAVTRTIQEDPTSDPQSRSRSLCRLAEVNARAGHMAVAQAAFGEAEAAIDIADLGGESAYLLIATTRAKIGDVAGGMRVARRIPGTWADRDHAIHDIVLILLEDGERGQAEQAARLIRPNAPQYYDGARIEICKSHALAGEMKRALALSEEIGSQSRRAQAVLEVCAIMARRGKEAEARRTAEGLTYPRIERSSPLPGEWSRTFAFNDYRTWGLEYDWRPRTFVVDYLIRQAAGDLTAAAMRCRVALDGEGSISYSSHIEKWDVRKAARAQAAEGDAKGALRWIDSLSAEKRVAALIGVAEGLVDQ